MALLRPLALRCRHLLAFAMAVLLTSPLFGSDIVDAALNADGTKVMELLKANPKAVSERDADNRTPLIAAACRGADMLKAIKALVAAGADLNAVDNWQNTALYRAAKNGDAAIVEYLLRAGADPSIVSGDGTTARQAAKNRDQKEVLAVFDRLAASTGPAPPPAVKSQPSALFHAARRGDIAALQAILQKSPDLNVRDADGWTALHCVVENNDKAMVALLLSHQADPNAVHPSDGQTPLTIAATYGYTEILRQLLDAHADPNAKMGNGSTALHRAAQNGFADIVAYLVLSKSKVDIRDNAGKTPADYAVANNHGDVLAVLVQAGAPIPPGTPPALVAAASHKPGSVPGLIGTYYSGQDFQEANLLLERVDPNIDFAWGQGAPGPGVPEDHFCVRWVGSLTIKQAGHYVLATSTDDGARLTIDGKLIIDQWLDQPEARAAGEMDLTVGDHDITMEMYDGTVDAAAHLRWSLQNGFTEVVIPPELFSHDPRQLKHAAPETPATTRPAAPVNTPAGSPDPANKVPVTGKLGPGTPLSSADQQIAVTAAETGDLATLKRLIEANPAYATAADDHNYTPLLMAARRNRLEVIRYLLSVGIPVDFSRRPGRSALEQAAEYDSLDALRLLLDNGSDINAPSDEGLPPLYFAINADEDHGPVIRELLRRGANPNLQNKVTGTTCLHRAVEKRDKVLVQLLIDYGADPNLKDTAGKSPLDYARAASLEDLVQILKTPAKSPRAN